MSRRGDRGRRSSAWSVTCVPAPPSPTTAGGAGCGRFETGGRWYERRLRIKAWKDRLPEAGALFAGGLSKRTLPAGVDRRAGLELLVVATRRAEWVHWVIPLLVPVFLVWNDVWVLAPMALYAVAANGPCLLVQRYNRARAVAALSRRAGRAAGRGSR